MLESNISLFFTHCGQRSYDIKQDICFEFRRASCRVADIHACAESLALIFSFSKVVVISYKRVVSFPIMRAASEVVSSYVPRQLRSLGK